MKLVMRLCGCTKKTRSKRVRKLSGVHRVQSILNAVSLASIYVR